MALTVTQEPNQLNAAYTNLVYTVSASDSSLFQYQYVMDVISGSERLARIRQYPNPDGVAVFDPSQIITDYLEYQDVNFSQVESVSDLTTSSVIAHTQFRPFTIRFGEEYGTSPSSSVILHDGYGNEGNTGVTGSNTPLYILPAQVDYNDYFQESFNFHTGSRKYIGEESFTFTYNKFFTLQPENDATSRTNDSIGVDYQDNGFVQILVSASSGERIDIDTTAYQADGTQVSSNGVDLSGITFPALLTIPCSPRQMGFSESEFNDADRFRIHVYDQGGQEFGTFFNIYKDLDACHYDRVSIQFINRLGAWDFYGFSLPSNENISVERDNYQKTFVDYSTSRTSGNTVTFNKRDGGTTSYNTSVSKNISFTTPYLSQKQALHVQQIFESPKIRLLYPEGVDSTRWQQEPMPVVLTDSSFVRNTNRRGQKLFQYTFNFELSNNPKGR